MRNQSTGTRDPNFSKNKDDDGLELGLGSETLAVGDIEMSRRGNRDDLAESSRSGSEENLTGKPNEIFVQTTVEVKSGNRPRVDDSHV